MAEPEDPQQSQANKVGELLAAIVTGGPEAADAMASVDSVTKSLTDSLLAVPGAAGKTVLAIGGLKAEAALLEGGFQGLFRSVGATGVAFQGFAKILDLLTRPTTELAQRQFVAATGFNKATSAAGEFDKQIFDSLFNLRQYGVDGKEFDAVLQAMYGTFTELGIDGISPTEQRLVELAAIMAEVGVPTEQSTKAMQGLNKVFGQTNEDIGKTMLGFDAFAEAIGMSAADVVSNFVSQIPYFALFGDEGEKAFDRLQIAAKTSGLEMDKMRSIAEGFDTFEGAAKQVGSLNAMLSGPYLNTIDLVRETDPTKRMMILQGAFKASGRSVEDMGYRQRQAFTSMIDGIDSADDLVKFLNADFDQMSELIGVAGGSAKDMAEEVKRGMMPEEQAQVLGMAALSLEEFGEQLRLINEMAFSDTLEDAETLRVNLNNLAGPILKAVGDSMRESLNDPLAMANENLMNLLVGAGVDTADITKMVGGAAASRVGQEVQEIILKVGDVDMKAWLTSKLPAAMRAAP
jgi:hypothetical protein